MYKNFSIVIPTYNSTKYLFELLRSTLKLVHLNEIIIIDDNSRKEEFEKINSICKENIFKNLNIKIFKNDENLGVFIIN